MSNEKKNSGFRSRWDVVRNGECDAERRVFAALELICSPLSFVTIFLVLPFQVAAPRLGLEIPGWLSAFFTVLLSAAIGYATNYIAIEMLFKPFNREDSHWLKYCTFGYWRQGLVPKNKPAIGVEVGNQVETHLLPPQQLADEIEKMALGLLDGPGVVPSLRDGVRTIVNDRRTDILKTADGFLKTALDRALREHITTENVRRFLSNEIVPSVNTPKLRDAAVTTILNDAAGYSPEIIELLKAEVRKTAEDMFERMTVGILSGRLLIDGVISNVSWDKVEERIRARIQSEECKNFLDQKLKAGGNELKGWLNSRESDAQVAELTDEIRTKIQEGLERLWTENSGALLSMVTDNDDIWRYIGTTLLPAVRPYLETLFHEKGRTLIESKLQLGRRVTDAIDRQDVREFYEMINKLAAQHLGAIQVLGYVLGGIIGAIQLLV